MKDETLQLIFKDAHAVAINMNDTFYYACADVACIDKTELEDLEPIVDKYGFDSFIAYEAIKRGHDPLDKFSSKNYKQAKNMIEKIMEKADEFGEFFELRDIIKMKNDGERKSISPKRRKRLSNLISKMRDGWYSFFY